MLTNLRGIPMEITINQETLVEKLNAQITKNLEANFAAKDLTEEEVAANMVLARKSIDRDAQVVADLVITALNAE
jgi:3-hydroxyacyl-CoA dehydrogenase